MICFGVTAPRPSPQWHMVTFPRARPVSYEVHRQTFLFQAAMRCSANRWHYSRADCTMIGTITVVLARRGICGCIKKKKKERNRQRWAGSRGTSSVSNLSVCLGDSWQPFCVKISPQISLPWKGGWHSLRPETGRAVSDVRRRYGKSSEAAAQNTESFF